MGLCSLIGSSGFHLHRSSCTVQADTEYGGVGSSGQKVPKHCVCSAPPCLSISAHTSQCDGACTRVVISLI